MEKHDKIFLKKSFVVITGAGKGLGRCMALQFGEKFLAGSVLLLLDIDLELLERAKLEVLSLAPNITVLVRQYDQGHSENKDYFKDIFNDVLAETKVSNDDFEQYMIVHNCATMGNVTKRSLDLSDSRSIRKYYDINLTGMILLNTNFFQTFSDSTKSRVIINMTSAATSTPLPPLQLHCAGKAARDMYMRVLAVEEPSLRILTFAPGASDTDMMKEVENLCPAKEIVEMLKQFRADGTMKHPDIAISKLVQILEENTFENAVYVESDKLF